MSERVAAYAEAMLAVARVEGSLELVSDQLYRFARALEGSDELRDALGDLHLPIDRRLRILEELLGGQAESVTVAVLSMAVAAGRARELPAIIDTMVQLAAAEAGNAVAEIRTAVELSPDPASASPMHSPERRARPSRSRSCSTPRCSAASSPRSATP